jgi:hypothetical protein
VRRLKKPQHLLLLLAADADAPADAELKTLLDVVSKNPAPRSSDDELMRTMAVRGEVCEGCQWLFDSQTLENDDGDTLPEPRYCGGGTERLSSVYIVELSMSFTAATAGTPAYADAH